MIYQRYQRLFVALLLPLLGLVAVLPSMVVANDQNVSPPAGPPGATFTFYASGFANNEAVVYWFNTPDGRIISNDSDYIVQANDGRADWQWTAPADAQPGPWSAVAAGRESDVRRIIPFEIGAATAAPAPQPATPAPAPAPVGTAVEQSVSPPAGPPGTTFSFYSLGFNYREKVGYWFNAPDGRVYADDFDYVVHSWEDRADWRWQSPYDAQPGHWTAIAKGFQSGFQVVLPFEITDPNAQPVAPAQPPARPDNPTDTGVTPSAGLPGTRFDFRASGYQPGERVGFWATDPLNRYYQKNSYHTTANNDGYAGWHWKSPETAMPGVWIMVGRGEVSNVEKVIYIEIISREGALLAGPTNPYDVAVVPLSDEPGARFTFYAHGFSHYETVEYWAIDPNGKEHDRNENETTSNADGRADWGWRTPVDAVPGIWIMYTHGTSSGVQRVIYFDVRSPGAPPAPPAIIVQPPPAEATPVPTASPVAAPIYPSQTAVQPSVAPPGTRFHFFATGFPPGESVSFWAVDPNGEEYRKSKYEVDANINGRADWNWLSPEHAPPGVWTMYALSEENRVQQTITFEVRP